MSIALDAIQSKRRVERVMEAATALLDRYATHPDPGDRATAFFELVRRNLTPEIALVHSGRALGTDGLVGVAGTEAVPPLPAGGQRGEVAFRAALTGEDGVIGSVAAYYTPPGALGLTAEEWQSAMRLLVGILGLGLGGSATL
ncbi:hypothetical protein M878_05810 [Streptomyces roseochromogenus subsp. oscitans DS 12.976]|uniref:GAF domain-containing protein n=1 Tax=Streptomyces roseochromogenus subsp. oscitans DS 12.976 TaxID=1352936 RepID=V6L2M0_STRRC|nr:hypothetical protein M878_05810 [Streptomyces roseochromogenus subsp. oscitans DS 12.976]